MLLKSLVVSILFIEIKQSFVGFFMLEKIRLFLSEIIAPGVEDAKKAEIKMIFNKSGGFRIDVNSFRNSKEVKRQIRLSKRN